MKLDIILREQLAKQRLTIDALGKATNVNTNTIKTWLSGKAPRNLDQVKIIAAYLNISFEYLVFGEDAQAERTLEQQVLESIFEGYLKVKIEKVVKIKSK